MLVSVLSIFAVDFPVFPRNYVKCENFGVSLVWSLDCDICFIIYLLKNLDGPWCRIFCVLTRCCICYTTYQRLRLPNFSNRVQVYTCDWQIAPNNCPRSYSRSPFKGNRLSGNLFRFEFLHTCWIFFLRHMKRNTAMGFFHHSCASSCHPDYSSSCSFTFSHSSRWNCRWSEYERNLPHVLNDIPLRSRTRLSSQSWRLSTFRTSRRFSDQCKQGRDYFPTR